MNIFLNIKIALRRSVVRRLNLHRPPSFSYITGDSFRALAQHIYDESIDFDPSRVQTGDIVFVRTSFLHDFFKQKHSQISAAYILITHNDDTAVTKEYEHFIDANIIHWFAENTLIHHRKITPIPIGIDNYYGNNSEKIKAFHKITKSRDRDMHDTGLIKIGYGFTLKSNKKERSAALHATEKNPLCIDVSAKNTEEYFKALETKQITHIISPEGLGPDCARTWEALYCGIIPIVKRSAFTSFFKEAGLPIILIDDWKEIETLDSKKLTSQFSSSISTINHPLLSMEYWMHLIYAKRNTYEQ